MLFKISIVIDMLKNIFLLAICLFTSTASFSQSFWFGPKGVVSFNVQNWNGFERDPYLSFNGDIYIATHDEFSRGSLYAQLGFHTRGSSTRVNFFNGNAFNQSFQFDNLVLEVGAKQKLTSETNAGPYYIVGLRGEYTLGTNLGEYVRFNSAFYPIDDFVRKFNYGVTVGGGWDFEFSELIGGLIELTVNPDLSNQYEQQAIANVVNPFNGQSVSLSERRVRNLTFEVKFGLRFMRKIEYID